MEKKGTGRVTVGHPVDVATGTLFHEFEDFTLPGRLPLVFGRRYSTALTERQDGMFGPGWSSPFEMRLRRDLDGYRLIAEDGETEITFDDESHLIEAGGAVRNFGQFHELRLQERTFIVTRWTPDSDEIIRYFFSKGQDGEWWPLQSRQNVAGQGADLSRDQQGRVVTLRQRREGRGFRLAYNREGRVAEVFLFTPRSERPVLRYSYDKAGRLAEMTDALGNRCSYEYNETGLMTRELSLGGMEFRFRYDSRGRCIETTGPDGFDHQQLKIIDEARLTQVTNPLGFITSYQWNESGQIEREISPLGHTRLTVYDNHGRIAQTISPGAVTAYEYDERGDRVKVTSPTGAVTQYEYNEHHQITGITDPAGHKWSWSFDNTGQPATWRDPSGNTWSYFHNSQGDLAAMKDPLGFERHFTWDESGNLISTTDWLEHRTTYEYNDEGRVIAMTDPLGFRTEAGEDALGRIRLIRHPDGTARKYSWNVYDQITEYTDELGAITRWRYTPCGLVRKVIRPHGGQIRFRYSNVPGQLITVTNENGAEHHYEYDADGRMIKETDFGGRITHYEYDRDGQVAAIVNAAGHRTELRRNAAGAITSVECDDGSKITYEYDSRGYLVKADNGDCPVEREYDAAGRLIVEKQGEYTITSRYDAAGNRLHRHSSLDRETRFEWDGNGQVKKIQTGELDPILFEYDARQCEVARYVPGGVRINQAFDGRGRQIEQWTGSARRPGRVSVGVSTAEGVHRQYKYDAASNLTEMLDARWGMTKYTYDPAGRITSAQHPNSFIERFLYDPADNFRKIERLTATAANVIPGETPDWQYGKGNELLRRDGVTYEYDALGQLVRKADAEGETSYHWNRFGQLSGVTLPGGAEWRYRYDAFSRRVEKQGPIQRVGFVWDKDVILHEAHQVKEDKADLIDWEFEPLGFAPIAKCVGKELYFCVNDIVGTPRELMAGNGNVKWAVKLLVFGGETESRAETECPLRFQGQWYDPETGMHYNRFRYYSPDLGRYITQDRIGMGGGENFYSYVLNPFLWVDPLGLVQVEHAPDFDTARRMAFERAGMTDPGLITATKFDASGTAVEFKGPGGAKVAYDGPHADMNPALGHDKPHIGWQSAGKRKGGGAERGNITYDGPPGPARSDCKT
ncbi:MAG TPA: polymorphic toxin type 47 domain-containing protein [Blastocatellia bacterium]|nr:polymorphic toxin type 47 domain-containing protein [Blastocatellia bacterium]